MLTNGSNAYGGEDAIKASSSQASASSVASAAMEKLVLHRQAMTTFQSYVDVAVSQGLSLIESGTFLRAAAKELSLNLSANEITKMTVAARSASRIDEGIIKAGQDVVIDEETSLWEGLFANNGTTMIIGGPKTGKTKFFLASIGAWPWGSAWDDPSNRQFLGRNFKGSCPAVIIVGNDMTKAQWLTAMADYGLATISKDVESNAVVGCTNSPIEKLIHMGGQVGLDAEGIELIANEASNYNGSIILVDSYNAAIRKLGISESSEELASPLRDLQEATAPLGASLVVIHHTNKVDTDDPVTACRGNTSLPSAVDQILLMTRPGSSEKLPIEGPRIIHSLGRLGEERFIVNMDNQKQWTLKGSIEEMESAAEMRRRVNQLGLEQRVAYKHLLAAGTDGLDSDGLVKLMTLDQEQQDPQRKARTYLSKLTTVGLAVKTVQKVGFAEGGTKGRWVASEFLADVSDDADASEGEAA